MNPFNSTVSMIIAVGKNGQIGFNNDIPWKSSIDMQWFKKQTMGKPIIMGRKTFNSLGKPLPGRFNIVVTRSPVIGILPGVLLARSPVDALDLAVRLTENLPSKEVFVIGGAEIYYALAPSVNTIYLTDVDYDGYADTYYPVNQLLEDFTEVSSTHVDAPAIGEEEHKLIFKIYERKVSK